MRNRPGAQIVTAFLISQKCDYLEALQYFFENFKVICLSLFCAFCVSIGMAGFDLEPRNNLQKIFKLLGEQSDEAEKMFYSEENDLLEKKVEKTIIFENDDGNANFEEANPEKLNEVYRKTDQDEFLPLKLH